MPLNTTFTQSSIQLRMFSQLLNGNSLPAVVSCISKSTCQYLMLASTVPSTNMALGPGAGTQTGRIYGLTPGGMSTMMSLRAAPTGIAGKEAKKFFDAVSFGVVLSLNTVIVQGSVIGAGAGTGIGKVVGLVPSALELLMLGQMLIKFILGKNNRALASSVAFGICSHIMSAGTVMLTDMGAAAPPPAGPVPLIAPGFGRFA